MPEDGTTSGSPHVAIPIDILPIGQGDHKTLCRRPDPDHRLIALATPPSNMTKDGKRAKRSVHKPAQEPIRDVFIQDAYSITQHHIPLENRDDHHRLRCQRAHYHLDDRIRAVERRKVRLILRQCEVGQDIG